MNIHHETRYQAQHKGKGSKVRRNDRRAVIARKNAFLTDMLTTRH